MQILILAQLMRLLSDNNNVDKMYDYSHKAHNGKPTFYELPITSSGDKVLIEKELKRINRKKK